MEHNHFNMIPHHLRISLSLLRFSLVFTLTISKQCNPYDENILLELKTRLGNPSTLVQYWTPTTDCCRNWASGINCDDVGHVTSLTLGFVDDVSGPIPPIIGELLFLRDLEFWQKNISGAIPCAICNLTNLEQLTIRETSMSGPIPYCLGRLTNLTQLDISLNDRITGPIPDSLAHLTNIHVLQLPANKLSGQIPYSLHHMRSLQWFNVESNQLSGSIPASLALIPNLTVIIMDNNKLSGSIPHSFGSFQNPITLDLHGNRLSGPIPGSLGRVNAYSMDFSSNGLVGDPSFLFGRNKTFALTINLSNNRFELDFSKVEFPAGLRDLNISHNMIYGSLPKQLGQLPLRSIDVSYNQLCGPIPTGRRLKRFSPIYFSNNKCLCGLPLPPCK